MGRKLRGMDTRAKIHALVEQYGITGESYIASVVNKHGSIGLERGLTVLPQGTVDAEEFLNEKDKFELQMKNVRRELETVEKSAMELEGYSKNPESIPLYLRNDFHRHVTIQNQLQQMQQHLKRIRQNMASEHGNMYTFVKHASIIDGKDFEKKMKPLLIKYFEELMQEKVDEARRIVEARDQEELVQERVDEAQRIVKARGE